MLFARNIHLYILYKIEHTFQWWSVKRGILFTCPILGFFDHSIGSLCLFGCLLGCLVGWLGGCLSGWLSARLHKKTTGIDLHRIFTVGWA